MSAGAVTAADPQFYCQEGSLPGDGYWLAATLVCLLKRLVPSLKQIKE